MIFKITRKIESSGGIEPRTISAQFEAINRWTKRAGRQAVVSLKGNQLDLSLIIIVIRALGS